MVDGKENYKFDLGVKGLTTIETVFTSFSSLSCSFLFNRSSFFLTFFSFFSSCFRSYEQIHILTHSNPRLITTPYPQNFLNCHFNTQQ